MWRSSSSRFDVATALDRGARDYQEDAVVADFPVGSDCGIGVLADGMGGHAAGDIASAIAVTEVFSELKFRFASLADREREIPVQLKTAVFQANTAMSQHVASHPAARGMGSTLVATVLVGPHLFWASVGDSPLFLHRDRGLRRLNENHSMAPHIDAMVASGQISAEVGLKHPERNCLTSAISGQKIARLDCPGGPFLLEAGDIVVVSSDGLQTLGDDQIDRLIQRNRKRPSAEIASELLEAVREFGLPEQDNCSLIVIKVLSDKPTARPAAAAGPGAAASSTRLLEATEFFDAVVLDDEETIARPLRAAGR